MDFLTEHERKAFSALSAWHSGGIIDFCTYMFHAKSPIISEKRYSERILLAIEKVEVDSDLAHDIMNEGPAFTKALCDWFDAYGNDDAEYLASLTIKVKQLNAVLREPLDIAQLNADDKAKVIKLNLDAAIGVDDLLKKKRDVESRIFADKESGNAIKRALMGSVSPESQMKVE